MEDTTYLFIDGQYLQTVYRDLIWNDYGSSHEIDFDRLRGNGVARRAFYYDCLDDNQKPNETETDFQARVQAQEAYLDSINAMEGFHVRKGYLAQGRRGREQKEVDVLLAVDMMVHSFNRTMTKAVLIAGDRDFKPVVEAVTRQGTYVEVWYRPKTGSAELGRVADLVKPLQISTLVSWVKHEGLEAEGLPSTQRFVNDDQLCPPEALLKRGIVQLSQQTMRLAYDKGRYIVDVFRGRVYDCRHTFHDLPLLEKFLVEEYGEITWRDVRDDTSTAKQD
ncbi:MAG: NYN domain-containing protein [Planctomycetes bacterium]|nr:NYN domain-containing protein [Planctomycetota bacterium]MBL7039829.1 NYN domain-containing protein [Pirellulaceae bacterium]